MKRAGRPKRTTEKTKLLICEGLTDKRFAERLKQIYKKRDSGFKIKIDDAGGGGPKSAIMTAITHAGGFDKKVVFIDSDLPITKEADAAAKRRGIPVIQSAPLCLEGMLLKIVGYKGEIRSSDEAKELFRIKYGIFVITETWFNDYITFDVIELIKSNDNHPCYKVITSLVSEFENF